MRIEEVEVWCCIDWLWRQKWRRCSAQIQRRHVEWQVRERRSDLDVWYRWRYREIERQISNGGGGCLSGCIPTRLDFRHGSLQEVERCDIDWSGIRQ